MLPRSRAPSVAPMPKAALFAAPLLSRTIRSAAPKLRFVPKLLLSPKSPNPEETPRRAEVPAALAWLSSADANPSDVDTPAPAPAAWFCTARLPPVRPENTLPEKRKTVKTNALASRGR